jgi:hypothetical protein
MGGRVWAKSAPGPDLVDIVSLITAFEAINKIKLELRMSRSMESRLPDLALTLVAWDAETGDPAVSTLASVSLTCLGTNMTSLAAVVIHGLYLLDAQIAKQEMAGAKPK